jgi:hemoglobin-like flavoprotein
MTTRQIQLVKESWGYVIVKSNEAGQLFYTRLFEVAPEVKHMFKGDMKEQARKLMSMVTLVVSKLDKLDNVINEVKALGARHNKYGTRPEHYSTVGQCLLWTLSQGLAERWNKETEEAWTLAYATLSGAMIQAQQQAPQPVVR